MNDCSQTIDTVKRKHLQLAYNTQNKNATSRNVLKLQQKARLRCMHMVMGYLWNHGTWRIPAIGSSSASSGSLYYRLSPLAHLPSPTLRSSSNFASSCVPSTVLQPRISGLPATFPRAVGAPPSPTVPSVTAQESRCSRCPSSWRGRPRGAHLTLHKRPGQPASPRLTRGPHILEFQ
jgi:hypothetical protein